MNEHEKANGQDNKSNIRHSSSTKLNSSLIYSLQGDKIGNLFRKFAIQMWLLWWGLFSLQIIMFLLCISPSNAILLKPSLCSAFYKYVYDSLFNNRYLDTNYIIRYFTIIFSLIYFIIIQLV